VAVGTPALMQRLAVDTADAPPLPGDGRHRSASWSLLALDGEVRARVGFDDALRAESAAAVAALRAQGRHVSLLSGDNEDAARGIAAAVGIEDWQADAGPEDKQARITSLVAGGQRVAMVGDGVNDAPALAAAHVGIAMGEGTDVAMETAGITLMRPDPRLVPAALSISAATLRTIRQNLFWAFVYNVVGIPVAALGLLEPGFAGAAMALSSVCVVTNSLRLRRWRPAGEEPGR
jgi:Cu+-exporting ATPase